LLGTKVLDLTIAIMAPLATQIHRDLSADVISTENPGGNTNRCMGAGSHPQLSGVFLDSHLAHTVIERLIATRQREHLATRIRGDYRAFSREDCILFTARLRPTAMRYAIESPKNRVQRSDFKCVLNQIAVLGITVLQSLAFQATCDAASAMMCASVRSTPCSWGLPLGDHLNAG
jgi:hypothetical protein